MNIIDVLLAVSIVFALSQGWRVGIIRGLSGFAGLVLGGWLALQTIPIAIDAFTLSRGWRILAGIGVVVGMAMLGQSVGFAAGSAIRRAFSWTPIRFIDSLLGSAFRVGSWAVIVWLLTSVMTYLPDRGIVHQVRTSEIVTTIDAYAPDVADRATAALRNVMRDNRFPQVFANMSPQPVHPVEPADPAVIDDPQVRAAFDSVLRVEAQADACEEVMTGTGFVFAKGRIMTNAHVVAGANQVHVEAWDGSRDYRADVVAFDAALDIAVLSVRGLDAPVLAFGPEADLDTQGVVPGFTGGGPLTPDPARVSDVMIARGHDIYGESRVDREIYVLRSNIAAGDSGAPLLGLDGRVLGVVFAAATDRDETGYALTAQAVRAIAKRSADATRAVPTGMCTA